MTLALGIEIVPGRYNQIVGKRSWRCASLRQEPVEVIDRRRAAKPVHRILKKVVVVRGEDAWHELRIK